MPTGSFLMNERTKIQNTAENTNNFLMMIDFCAYLQERKTNYNTSGAFCSISESLILVKLINAKMNANTEIYLAIDRTCHAAKYFSQLGNI